ncbi:MAG: hypothetical protein WBF13_13760 [Candidatus Zixiibacteriota bacterium]
MMWRFISPIIIISCFLINCHSSKSIKKTIVYPDKIETENYIIHKDATVLPNWSHYYGLMRSYADSNGSVFGPSLYRGGEWWSSVGDGKGIYLDIVPNNRYVLFFPLGKHDPKNPQLGCILVKDKVSPETTELLISRDDIRKILPPGITEVFGFKNEELILARLYFISMWNER